MGSVGVLDYTNILNRWIERAKDDPDLIEELESIKGNDAEIEDRFYKELDFGTAGLRGVIGAGTNRMNIYIVGKATQGIAKYLLESFENPTVAIAYDSRIKSELFARTTASVFAANGIKAYIYKELMPTPMLSFAVRYNKCAAGINVTASHNPAKYNGYKVYGDDGCQLTLEATNAVLEHIKTIDVFDDVKWMNFDEAMSKGLVEFIGEDTSEAYFNEVQKKAINPSVFDDGKFKVVYSPLHGAGNKPVREILKRCGVKNVTVVKSQELPDGNFPTAPYPNPEIRQAFEEALKVADEVKPDILLATDPDCDRVGIAVNVDGEYKLMTGNEVGVMLLNYVLSQKKANGTLPENPVAVKTIVSSELAQKVADKYGCELVNVLTGFKFIGEQIKLLEEKGEDDRFVFGFEESYGYLAGSYVRDKDAVIASMLICEMAAYYKTQGKTLVDVINSLYEEFGYYLHTQLSFTFEGISGMKRMAEIMDDFRNNPPKEFNGYKVENIADYETSVATDVKSGKTKKILLPKSNVLAYNLEKGASVIVRPSGTEPKVKIYLTVVGNSSEETIAAKEEFEKYFNGIIK